MAYFAKNEGVKTVLDIGSEKANGDGQTLLMEIGKTFCSTAYLQRGAGAIGKVQLTEFDELAMEEEFPTLLEPLKGETFESVVVCAAFPQAILFPHKYFKRDYSALKAVYDLPAQAYFYDSIEEWQMVNAYAVPESIYDSLTDAFAKVQFIHCYTPAIKVYNGFVADNQLSVHFTGRYFRVLLKKEMAVQLVQTYAYKTPLDVVYYLLKICREFGVSQADVYLILSGLVEKESTLYAEVRQYFGQVHFAQQPVIKLPQSPHPHHFFTSLYNLAACVS